MLIILSNNKAIFVCIYIATTCVCLNTLAKPEVKPNGDQTRMEGDIITMVRHLNLDL